MRELSFEEIGLVAGGPGPLVVLAWVAGAAAAGVAADIAVKVIGGMSDGFTDGNNNVLDVGSVGGNGGGGW